MILVLLWIIHKNLELKKTQIDQTWQLSFTADIIDLSYKLRPFKYNTHVSLSEPITELTTFYIIFYS